MSLRPKGDRPTAPALAFMGAVKEMRCICCALMRRKQTTPTEFHHIRAGGQARNDFLGIPLCEDCHRGPNGVELNQTYMKILKVSEWDLLARVIELVFLRQMVADDEPF
jgi:hypothetical protein